MKNSDLICTYCNECKIYKGELEHMDIPLYVYKNVFCHRGIRGWNNCKQFLIYKKKESVYTFKYK